MLRPKFITFDCQGTLTLNPFPAWSRKLFADRLPADRMDAFINDFRGYRFDEALGPWKPYNELLANAVARTCRKHGIAVRPEDAQAIYDDVPNWRPHPDVVAGLARVGREYPLVALTNSMDSQIMQVVERYGTPFHKVITAEQVQSYKPHMKGFEDMMEILDARPEDLLHVSSSFRYDLMTAYDLGIKNKAWVNRGHEPPNPFYEYQEIADIGGLAGLVGL